MSNSHRRGPGAPVEKAKDFKGSIGKLVKYMSEYKLALIFVVIFAIISSGYETLATISQNYRLDVLPLNKRLS